MIEKCYWEEGSRQQWIFYANDNSSLDGLSEKLIIDDVLCSSDEKIENLGIKRVNGKLYSGNYVGVCRIKSLNGKNITSIDGREVILKIEPRFPVSVVDMLNALRDDNEFERYLAPQTNRINEAYREIEDLNDNELFHFFENEDPIFLKDSKCGVYKYVEATDFDILLFGYAVDGGEVIVVDLAAREKIPVEILAALADENITKWAFNSNFERVCLSEWLRRNHPEYFGSYSVDSDTVGNYLNPRGWECSMIWSAFMGLPLSLAGVGAVLGLEEQKLKEGKDLIRYFCVPCKATKSNGGRTRNLPEHDMDKWKLFKFYNQGDVEVEQSIQKKLVNYPVPDFVWEEFWLDQEINARGIQLDLTMVENAISLDEISKEKLVAAMREITDLDNPNSVAQMKVWLAEQGVEAESLGKKDVAKLMDEVEGDVKDALLLRQ